MARLNAGAEFESLSADFLYFLDLSILDLGDVQYSKMESISNLKKKDY